MVLFRGTNLPIRFGFDVLSVELEAIIKCKGEESEAIFSKKSRYSNTCLLLDNVQLVFANGVGFVLIWESLRKRRENDEADGCIGKNTTVG